VVREAARPDGPLGDRGRRWRGVYSGNHRLHPSARVLRA